MASAIERVHIVGPGGSGKTTLGRQLARILRVEPVDLDLIAYGNGVGPKRSGAERQAAVADIASGGKWVTDGGYAWPSHLFERADLLVWLDLPAVVCVRRVVTRHVKASIARNNRHPGIRELFWFTLSVLRHWDPATDPGKPNWDVDAMSRRQLERILSPFDGKLARCRSVRDVRNVVARVAATV